MLKKSTALFVFLIGVQISFATANEVQRYGAEDAALSRIATKSDLSKSFDGTGYASYPALRGAFTEWSVSVASTGIYRLTWTYRLDQEPQSLSVSVDSGKNTLPLFFQSTESTSPWATRSLVTELTSGQHVIRLIGDGQPGLLIDSLDVAQARYRINFAPIDSLSPPGWETDTGQPYGLQASGLNYGWIDPVSGAPINVSAGARNRDPSPDIDLFRETLIHMAHPDGASPHADWEFAIANGNYRVSLQVGDTISESTAGTRHRVYAEGVELVDFQVEEGLGVRNASAIVSVQDGKLTLTSAAQDNAKIHLALIESTDGVQTPLVLGSLPKDGAIDTPRDVTISANFLSLPNPDQDGLSGVDNTTISTSNVALFEVTVAGDTPQDITVNGTGGGDAINISPVNALAANTAYRWIIDGVQDLAGETLLPFSSVFSTGSGIGAPSDGLDNVAFERIGPVSFGAYTSLLFGPDGMLYGLSLFGDIDRWTVSADGTLQNKQTLGAWHQAYGSVNAIGLAFDPTSSAGNLLAYVSHVSGGFLGGGGPTWDGKISRLSGPDLETAELLVTNLPRSLKDHLTNSIVFKEDEPGALYFNQGSNSAGGQADPVWGNRPERLLSAATLKLELSRLPSQLPLNAQTSEDQSVIDSAGTNSPTMSDGSYNPYYLNAPLTLYATGVRNAYDLAWHSNEQLYIPTNGTAGGSYSPASASGTRRPDGSLYNGQTIPGVGPNSTQHDWLFRIDPGLPTGYYGHPNPMRGEFVLNRGPQDETNYPAAILPDSNYRGAAFDFGFNRSPNGVIEYRSSAHDDNLRGALLVTRYSTGSDIIALLPNGPGGDIGSFRTDIPGFTGFSDPLDIVEDTANGNLYVSDLATGEIILLRPTEVEPPQASSGFQQDPSTGLVSIEIEHYSAKTSAGDHDWQPVAEAGASGSQSLQARPNNGTIIKSRNDVASSPRIDLLVNFSQTGTHYLWLRGLASKRSDDTVHTGIDGVAPKTADGIKNFTDTWSWTNTTLGSNAPRAIIDVPSIGEHVINVWMREDGLILDKLVLTTDPDYLPTSDGNEGPDESPRGQVLPGLLFNTASLTFNAQTGTSSPSEQFVSLDTSDGTVASYSIVSDQTWLTVLPSGGITPAISIAVSANPAGLTAGIYTGTLTVSGAGYTDDDIAVTLEVIDPPPLSLQFEVIGLSFSADESGPSPPDQVVTLVTSDNQSAGYSIESNQGWLTTSPQAGTTPSGAIAVSVNSGGLSAGRHSGTLTASASGYGDDTVEVTVDVAGSSDGFQQDPSTGLVSIEIENYNATTSAEGHDWQSVSRSGASGAASLQALPNNGTNIGSKANVTNSPRLDFMVNFATSGTHYLWLRGLAPSGADNTAHAGIDGAATSTADRIGNFQPGWSWINRTLGVGLPVAVLNVPSPGEHVVNVWMREDGLILDKLVLTTDPDYLPTNDGNEGPDESPRGPVLPGLLFNSTSLTFTAQTGTSSPSDQFVSLNTSDAATASYLIMSDQTWLTTTPLAGATPSGVIAVSVNSSGLSAGRYTGTLTASASGYGDDTIEVTLNVTGASGGFQQDPATGLVSIEIEHYDASTPRDDHEWLDATPSGASAGGAMQALPNNGANLDTGYASNSPQLDFLVNFAASGKHYLWLRGIGSTNSDDSAHVGLDEASLSSADRITRFGASWKWTKSTMDGPRATIDVPSPGEHVINVWMREDGLVLDKIVLTTDADYSPTANGPIESPR